MKTDSLSEDIKKIAESSRIDVIGFADASEFSDYSLKNSKRKDPKLSLPKAKSIIIIGIYIGGIVLPKWKNPLYARTSRLWLSDYFNDIVKPLKPISGFLIKEGYEALICEGGSSLPLKLAAVRAGIGWQGRHSLLISKKYGTFLALGGIITDALLKNNTTKEDNLKIIRYRCSS